MGLRVALFFCDRQWEPISERILNVLHEKSKIYLKGDQGMKWTTEEVRDWKIYLFKFSLQVHINIITVFILATQKEIHWIHC